MPILYDSHRVFFRFIRRCQVDSAISSANSDLSLVKNADSCCWGVAGLMLDIERIHCYSAIRFKYVGIKSQRS